MSVSAPSLPETPQWDPQAGDLNRSHGLMPSDLKRLIAPPTPQQLHAAGWMDCPRCHKFWLSPQNKAAIEAAHGYFVCPQCKLTTDLMHNLPWHGVAEPDYYPKHGTGGGTAVGLPMGDVGQIAENIVRQMGEIPGYGPIVWWHSGTAESQSPLDGATPEWGIEVKGIVYDAVGHFWDPGRGDEVTAKNQAAAQMGLKGILGVAVILNFRNDLADVYVKAMPVGGWVNTKGLSIEGIAKWHKRTGTKVASNIPFESPYKDPNNPAPGPYSMADYYKKPEPIGVQPEAPEDMPF